MLEEGDEQGHTRVSIVASPGLGAINETDLIKTVLAELSKGKDSQRMMTEIWAQAKTLRLKRTQPFTTLSGKLIPLHIHKHR